LTLESNCGEPHCGSFYLTQYIENEKELEGFSFEGIGTIEVCEGKISFNFNGQDTNNESSLNASKMD
jgi:hypothetical protein